MYALAGRVVEVTCVGADACAVFVEVPLGVWEDVDVELFRAFARALAKAFGRLHRRVRPVRP